MKLIGQAHTLVHQNGVIRIQSDIRVGTRYCHISTPSPPHLTSSRTDKKQHFSEKVTKVESILAADGKAEEKVVVVQPEEPKKVEDVVKPAAEAPKKAEVVKESKPEERRQPLTPATNQGTWASMFRK